MSIFSKIKINKPKRTVHNLSYSSQLSLPFGRLIPIMCEKVVPGDKFVHGHEFLLRFAPFVGQVFQSFQTRVEYFYVPSRLLWDNFEKFLVADDASEYVHPYFEFSLLNNGDEDMTGTLVDYFNLPTVNRSIVPPYYVPIDGTGTGDIKVDALPWMAYLKIFLDYYQDENLLLVPDGQGGYLDYQGLCDLIEDFKSNDGNWEALMSVFAALNGIEYSQSSVMANVLSPFHRAYPKDYFTSALPWAQRGPLVQIPLNGSGDVIATTFGPAGPRGVKYTGVNMQIPDVAPGRITEVTLKQGLNLGSVGGNSRTDVATNELFTGQSAITQYGGLSVTNLNEVVRNNPEITFKAVNVNGTATITDLRTAFAVQAWLEKNARAGVRYKEQLMSHFGVRSRDYRLDRAQLLQSSKATVSIGEVFTTAANDDGTFIPGLGISTATGSTAVKPFKHYFDEHGYVIGLMSIFPKASYYQGIPRQMLELDKFDYYWPEFQHIGEQDIKGMELFVDDEMGSNNTATFGYTPRYAQYKQRTNQVHGDFRTSLMYMHDGRSFLNSPRLNMDFINVDVKKNDLYRVFNYTEESPFCNAYPVYCDFFHNFKAIRPMSYFGTPRII